MKFEPVLKPVSSLWDEYLAYLIEPPAVGSEAYQKQKIIFFSALTMFIEYLKYSFPVVKTNPTALERAKYQAQLQAIYDQAKKVLEDMV